MRWYSILKIEVEMNSWFGCFWVKMSREVGMSIHTYIIAQMFTQNKPAKYHATYSAGGRRGE